MHSIRGWAQAHKSDLSLLFCVVVWGLNFAILKAAIGVMHPHVVNIFRFVFSLFVLGGLYYAEYRETQAPFFGPLREYFWRIFGLGLLGFLLYQFCFIVGISNTTAGNGALIMSSAQLWTALIAGILGIERIRRGAWAGLFAMLGGVAIIVIGGNQDISFGSTTLFGDAVILMAAVLWGTYTVLIKPLLKVLTPTSLAFFGLLLAFPFLLALGANYLHTVSWQAIDAWVWLAIIYSGSLSTGLTVALWNIAIRDVGPSQTSAYGNLVPIVGIVSGVILLGEKVTWIQIAGGILILGGLLVMRRFRTRPTALALQER